MKIVLKIISVLIIAAIVFIALLNTQTALNLVFWSKKGAETLIYHTTLAQVISGSFIAGILAGALWILSFYFSSKTKLKEYQRKLEKTSLQSGEESSKAAVLEAKIQTLEKALKTALEKND